MTRIFFVFIVFLPFLVVSEVKSDEENNVKPDEKNSEHKNDSDITNGKKESEYPCPKPENEKLKNENDCKEAIKTYQEILEKTNSQLSLWYTPYNLILAIMAIFVTILIYWQNTVNKMLMKESLRKHENTLNKLIAEKESRMKILDASMENEINKYNNELALSSDANKKEIIKEIVDNLKTRKMIFEIQENARKHSGNKNVDFQENCEIDETTIFNSLILLDKTDQRFTIFLKIVGNDNKKYWLGFGNRSDIKEEKIWTSPGGSEFDILRNYNSEVVDIKENIWNQFKRGFPAIDPVEIIGIRFRGSDENKNEITFSYKIVQPENDSNK